jgi:DMSO/TMAO reductase YedYZ molybdopterin-dependent catalytic subunit
MALITIGGEISIPRGFTFEELRGAPEQVSERLLAAGNIRGVRLRALVAPLGPKPWARFLVAHGADGYAANLPLAALDDCILVYAIGQRPLWADLGGPLRLFADGHGRCANVKAVTRIALAESAAPVEHACRHQREAVRTRTDGGTQSNRSLSTRRRNETSH